MSEWEEDRNGIAASPVPLLRWWSMHARRYVVACWCAGSTPARTCVTAVPAVRVGEVWSTRRCTVTAVPPFYHHRSPAALSRQSATSPARDRTPATTLCSTPATPSPSAPSAPSSWPNAVPAVSGSFISDIERFAESLCQYEMAVAKASVFFIIAAPRVHIMGHSN